MNEIALTLLPRELAAYAGQHAPGYRRLYQMVVDGRLPAHQTNGRWHVRRTDLPAIAAALGMSGPRTNAIAA